MASELELIGAEIAESLRRIAAAEERRNELLEAEGAARRAAWEAEQRAMADRWAELTKAGPPPLDASDSVSAMQRTGDDA